MKKFVVCLLVFIMVLSMSLPALGTSVSNQNKGTLIIIGGALQPENKAIYEKFIELGGKSKENSKIAIIPAASNTPIQSGNSYKTDFVDLYGVPEENVKIFPIAIKDDSSTENVDESTWLNNAFDETLAIEMLNYNIVFFTGGDQLRIITALTDDAGNDSPVLTSIRTIYTNGGVIGGSSAGAAIMSDPMIGGGSSFGALTQGVTEIDNYDDPEDNRVFLTKGIGFFKEGLTDQHFLKRGRFGRLITACIDRNIPMGYGIDEDTAMVVTGDIMEVVGESAVMIVDTSKASKDYYGTQLAASNIILHYLEDGDKYNMVTGEFTINDAKLSTSDYEYYSGNSLNSDIFGADSVVKTITYDLVDNTMKETVGIAFDLNETGIKLTFKKGAGTEGFWGKIDGEESYAAVNVYLDIIPVKVEIKEVNSTSNGNRHIYTVKKGDTLASIAIKLGMKMNTLIEINNIDDPELIFVGQKLYLSK